MHKPVGKSYSFLWVVIVALALIASLPLEWHNFYPHWAYIASVISIFALGGFFGGETAAGSSAPGTNGTMTNWMDTRVEPNTPKMKVTNLSSAWAVLRGNWQRILVGVWLSALIMIRINPWLGGVFMLWLPIHYANIGAGPMDMVFRGIGKVLGITIITY